MSLTAPRAGSRRLVATRFGRSLYEQPFYYPDGKGGEWEKIFSMWRYEGNMPVIVFPVTDDGRVIAIRQFRHGLNDFMIETPGGLPKHGESPEEVVRAELFEETGYRPAEIVVHPHQIWPDAPYFNVRFTPCICFGCVRVGEPKLDRTETLETILVPLKEWYDMLWRGEIIDAKFFALSLLALPFLKEKMGFGL